MKIRIKRRNKSRMVFGLSMFAALMSSNVNAATCAATDSASFGACLFGVDDIIELAPGTYTSTFPLIDGERGRVFLVTRGVTIRGATGHPEDVVLSGDFNGDDMNSHGSFPNSSDNAFHVMVIDGGAPVIIEGLTIQGGNNNPFTGSGTGFAVGGGIVAAASQDVTLNNVIMKDNQAFFGGGAVWGGDDATWTISASVFENNFVLGGEAGAIVFGFRNLVDIDDSSFNENTAGSNNAGAIAISFNSSSTIANSSFTGNRASGGGGAISIFGGQSTLTKNSFAENSSVFDGGAVAITGGFNAPTDSINIVLENNKFTDNSTDGWGGAVSANFIVTKDAGSPRSSLTMTGNHYTRNSAVTSGGAVQIGLDPTFTPEDDPVGPNPNENVTMEKEHYRFNTSAGRAGALEVLDTQGSLAKIHFNHNDASGNADSLFVEASPDLTFSKIKVAGEDAGDCSINEYLFCP